MLKVYKYPFDPDDFININMPRESKILAVQSQFDQPCLWALVNPKAPLITRRFRMAGTGHPIDGEKEDLDYVGTFQMYGGSLVFHLFEL